MLKRYVPSGIHGLKIKHQYSRGKLCRTRWGFGAWITSTTYNRSVNKPYERRPYAVHVEMRIIRPPATASNRHSAQFLASSSTFERIQRDSWNRRVSR